jgi:Rap1a immunity proteins
VKFETCAVATALLLALAPSTGHAVTDADFTASTTGELVALCNPQPESPLATAAINFCYGFAQGAVSVEMQRDAASRGPKLFCLPTPPPARSKTMAEFVQWARTSPDHMADPPADGLFRFLGQRFPCPKNR